MMDGMSYDGNIAAIIDQQNIALEKYMVYVFDQLGGRLR